MESDYENIVRSKSVINYSYATIKITQSRIDKGLIAIPVSLTDYFPLKNETIQVYLNDSPDSQTKNYSAYSSSTRECRIGGVKDWFKQNNIQNGDEIVIQIIDKENFIYRLILERKFIDKTQELENSLDISDNDKEAEEKISTLTKWTQVDKQSVVINEYLRLTKILSSEKRQYTNERSIRAKETIPANMKALLENIYQGHCQICDFWFLKLDKHLYFEIHHLDPSKGHHPKNLIVVCGNCHNQFEYSSVKHEFNTDLWLITVSFNEFLYPVKQISLDLLNKNFSKDLFI